MTAGSLPCAVRGCISGGAGLGGAGQPDTADDLGSGVWGWAEVSRHCGRDLGVKMLVEVAWGRVWSGHGSVLKVASPLFPGYELQWVLVCCRELMRRTEAQQQ